MKQKFSSIFITGASSGLGRALALALATKKTTLFLTGRNETRLKEVAALCAQKGAQVHTFIFDVRDREKAKESLKKAMKICPLDLVIINAGVSLAMAQDQDPKTPLYTLFDTNVGGVVNTSIPALSLLLNQGHGHLCFISSMAGFRGLPSCPAYAASKNFVRAWAEGLSVAVPKDIHISCVCPGFIKTPLTDKNTFKMPGLMSADKAAHIIIRALSKNKRLITFPWFLSFFAGLAGLLPSSLILPILAHLPKKAEEIDVLHRPF